MKKKAFNSCRVFAMALAATVAGMATTSCEKEDDILPDEPKKEIKEPVVKKNKYYNMYCDSYEATDSIPASNVFDIDFISAELAKDDTDTMFIVPRGTLWKYQGVEVMSIVANHMRRWEEIGGDRILGAGQINFKPGEPSRALGDSLYLCSRGILINPVKTR